LNSKLKPSGIVSLVDKLRVAYDIREFKKITTATATATSLNKRFNEQNNGCAGSWCISLPSSAKPQREMTKFCVVWRL